jgi:hypothetical protein
MAPVTWPPIIRDADRPRVIVWRDRICTAAMWLLLLWLCRSGLRGLSEASWTLLRDGRLDFAEGLESLIRLRHYFEVIGLLALWEIAWMTVTLWRRRRFLHLPQPAPLTSQEEVGKAIGLSADLSPWRKLKVCVAHLDTQGNVFVLPKKREDNERMADREQPPTHIG